MTILTIYLCLWLLSVWNVIIHRLGISMQIDLLFDYEVCDFSCNLLYLTKITRQLKVNMNAILLISRMNLISRILQNLYAWCISYFLFTTWKPQFLVLKGNCKRCTRCCPLVDVDVVSRQYDSRLVLPKNLLNLVLILCKSFWLHLDFNHPILPTFPIVRILYEQRRRRRSAHVVFYTQAKGRKINLIATFLLVILRGWI